MKKAIYILVLLLVILFGCRTPKTLMNDTKLTEQKDIENNILYDEASRIDQLINQALQKYISETLNIHINNRFYDTEKPRDNETGKPPLKEEINVNVNKEIKEATTETVKTETTELGVSQFEDKSTDKSKVTNSDKTKIKTGLTTWQKILIGIGLASLIGFILFIISKLKNWL